MKELITCNLDVEEINGIFKDCLAKENSKETIRTVLFQKSHGFKEDSRAIHFDKKMIEFYKPQLEYSLGQLQDVHENYTSVSTESVKDRYDEVQWTENTQTVMAYLHLLLAANLVKPIEFSTGELEFVDTVYPTLLSSDKNQIKWYKQYRDKIYIEFLEKALGQEPADD